MKIVMYQAGSRYLICGDFIIYLVASFNFIENTGFIIKLNYELIKKAH